MKNVSSKTAIALVTLGLVDFGCKVTSSSPRTPSPIQGAEQEETGRASSDAKASAPAAEASAPISQGDINTTTTTISSVPVRSTTTAPTGVQEGRYTFKGAASDKCLAEPHGDALGLPLELQACKNNEASQIFTLERIKDNVFKVYSPGLRILEIRGGLISGDLIQQGNGYTGGDHQQFDFELQVDKKTYMVRIKNSELAWEVSSGATTDGSLIISNKANGSSSQRWTMTRLPD